MKALATLLYVLCIPAANWMIGHVGTCGAGPCVVPVWFGLMAPSGVVVIGAALCLRDAVQHYGGKRWTYACVAFGALVSAAIAPPMLALASAGAFAVSELADTLVYGAVAKRSRPGAVLVSGIVGLGVDSVLFLWLAFGSLTYLSGQIVGKGWAVLAGSVAVWAWGRIRSGSGR
jgi:uncharacterized PurR-regulated membrane protein YhhQ (DUF165 family)